MKIIATMIAAALALVLQGGFAAAHANATSAHCTGLTATDYISSDHDDITSSTSYVNVTEASLNFTTSGTGCVIITFSGLAAVSAPGYVNVRTFLDGHSNCAPGNTADVFLGNLSSPTLSANSITRICTVGPGVHSVQVQFKSQYGHKVEIRGHELTVTHN